MTIIVLQFLDQLLTLCALLSDAAEAGSWLVLRLTVGAGTTPFPFPLESSPSRSGLPPSFLTWVSDSDMAILTLYSQDLSLKEEVTVRAWMARSQVVLPVGFS